MIEIERSERIKALQKYAEVQGDAIRGYKKYAKLREQQKVQHQEKQSVKITEVNADGSEDVGQLIFLIHFFLQDKPVFDC